MQQTNNIFKIILRKTGENIIKPSSNSKNGGSDDLIFYYLLGILFFVGADAARVLLRTNFGKNAISRFRIFIGFLVFIIWGTSCILLANFTVDSKMIDFFSKSGDRTALFLIAFFYYFLAICLLVLGFSEKIIALSSSNHPDFGGSSIHFTRFIGNTKNSPFIVQFILEPLFVFSLGVLLSGIHILLGFPILVSGISFLLIQVYEKYFLQSDAIYINLSNINNNSKNYQEVR